MAFAHLHCHSHYSLLTGLGKPADFLKGAKEMGMGALAITDVKCVYGLIEFYKKAKELEVNPVLGIEVFVRDESEDANRGFELVLLAENNEGYQNILALQTAANLGDEECFVSFELLKKHAKGVIALSGGVEGEVAQRCISEGVESGAASARRYLEIFGEGNFFLEIQKRPEIVEYTTAYQAILDISEKLGVKLVATNSCRYVKSEQRQAHDILVCIGEGKTVHAQDRLRFDGDYSLYSEEKMRELFADVPEAVDITAEIAQRCDVKLEFGNYLIPAFDTPDGYDAESYLRHLCEEGLRQRYGGEIPKEAQERLDYELKTVHEMGFDTYFLIVWDFINYAKSKEIVVGPGRGSAAGSIIAYSLRITELDPLKYGLIFERFLNPERISMPDIDIDFEDDRREEVLEYVVEKYGRNAVAQIITFGTMAAKAAIRDVGRALGYPYSEVDRIAKLVPPAVLGKYAPLACSIKDDPELKSVYENEPRVKVLLDNAVSLEGSVRNVGTHACAVIIADRDLTEYTVLQNPSGQNEGIVTQFSMGPLESLGLLKMDFLGLKNLTIIRKAKELAEQRRGVEVDLEGLDLHDEGAFKLLQKGDTTGVFQLESAGMRRYLKELKPTELADIIAMNALYRPGPMQYIPQYIKGKHDPKSVEYLDDSFETILSETYGVAVYQEQVLMIAQDFSGFSLGQADILRKAVGKKIPALLAEQRVKFVEGAINKGHSKKFAEKVFDEVVEPFAGYGFNKAHAACYGYIAYVTAFLKSHFPAEFMAMLMTADKGNTDKLVFEIGECIGMGIDVLPPSINDSFTDFTVVDDETIRFGLGAIKGVGDSTVEAIIDVRRESGKFESLEDFAKRVPYKFLNKKVIEALAYSGAFDGMADRRAIAESYEDISDFAKGFQGKNDQSQTDIFAQITDDVTESFKLKQVQETSFLDQLAYEKEYLGLYVSGHPLQGLKRYFGAKVKLICNLRKKLCGKPVKVGGLITDARRIMTKKGDYMMYLTFEDPTGKLEGVVFTRAYKKFAEVLQVGNVVFLQGKLDWRRDKFQIRVDEVRKVSLERMIENAKNQGSYDLNERVVFCSFDDIEDEDDEGGDNNGGVNGNGGKVEKKVNGMDYVIRVPRTADLSALEKIKQELLGSKGESSVEILIEAAQGLKRIKVPFGVNLTDDLKNRVDQLLKAN